MEAVVAVAVVATVVCSPGMASGLADPAGPAEDGHCSDDVRKGGPLARTVAGAGRRDGHFCRLDSQQSSTASVVAQWRTASDPSVPTSFA